MVVVDTAAVLRQVSILPRHGNDPYGTQIKHPSYAIRFDQNTCMQLELDQYTNRIINKPP
jgi:hypothetical protein